MTDEDIYKFESYINRILYGVATGTYEPPEDPPPIPLEPCHFCGGEPMESRVTYGHGDFGRQLRCCNFVAGDSYHSERPENNWNKLMRRLRDE